MGTSSPPIPTVSYSLVMESARMSTPVSNGIHDAPTTSDWLREMRGMRKEAREERVEQTTAFVGALANLGDKIDGNAAGLRSELRRQLNVMSLLFLVSFVVLAGLAGSTVYFKFGRIEAGSGTPAHVNAAPTP